MSEIDVAVKPWPEFLSAVDEQIGDAKYWPPRAEGNVIHAERYFTIHSSLRKVHEMLAVAPKSKDLQRLLLVIMQYARGHGSWSISWEDGKLMIGTEEKEDNGKSKSGD